jgi:hypothetical protein
MQRVTVDRLYEKLLNFAELTAVRYTSNGGTLNATFWLSDAFRETPSGYTPSYAMLIDADSNMHTGSRGIDYVVQIIWNDSRLRGICMKIQSNRNP